MRFNDDRRHFKGNPRHAGRTFGQGGRPFRNAGRSQQQGRPGHPPAFPGNRVDEFPERPEQEELPDSTSTGAEAAYMRSLIDSHTLVTVVLTTGERLRGTIRYYDRDMLSLGQVDGPNLFLPKQSIHSIYEE